MTISPSRETNPNPQPPKTPQNPQFSPRTDDQETFDDDQNQSKTPKKSPKPASNQRKPSHSPRRSARLKSRVLDDKDDGGGGGGGGGGSEKKRKFRVLGGSDSAEETGVVGSALDWNVGEEIDDEGASEGGSAKGRKQRTRGSSDNGSCFMELKDGIEDKDDLVCGERRHSREDLVCGERRHSREEKGKGVMTEESETLIAKDLLSLDFDYMEQDAELLVATFFGMRREMIEKARKKIAIWMVREKAENMKEMKEKFKKSARERAERFALGLDGGRRTAQPNISTSYKNKPTLLKIEWTPSNDRRRNCLVPSLLYLSASVLAKYSKFVSSFDGIPDLAKNIISQMLCQLLRDSQSMNDHVVELVFRGSPTERMKGRVRWLRNKKKNTLAKSENSMPSLVSISLRGALHLSDDGLASLISSAPRLESINLGQCYLLTTSGISNMLVSLGSSVKELYLDDCHDIEAMLILPDLMELQNLEVLSLKSINTVCDYFVDGLVSSCGQTIKELFLANCSELTDDAVGTIAAFCCGLRSLDICNMYKLTDVAIDYLIHGFRSMEVLKLGCNSFSDEAIAALIKASGKSLVELSLNKLTKVGPSTAISISRRCSRNLQFLDLSWCRNLTDDAMGIIADNCMSLRLLKLFGCTQITRRFINRHSNPFVRILGLPMTPLLEHLNIADRHYGPLHYTQHSMKRQTFFCSEISSPVFVTYNLNCSFSIKLKEDGHLADASTEFSQCSLIVFFDKSDRLDTL
ncbi:hypothetical protein Syun_030821 [Stephania yunnanensis]|uniref:F-box/LRR-repeat protein 15-like leucin rich repeat domain-containing protein n=1 Tax=Stephania yunnanensis TaxID=152371 RepID=A0AAP0DZE7_9MAGN